jgi:hypothetical protein
LIRIACPPPAFSVGGSLEEASYARGIYLVAAGAAATLSGAALAQKASNQFDGNWSVQVLTEKGDCEKVYRYPIIVQNGASATAGRKVSRPSGGVSPNGAVKGSISRGDGGPT